jgi:hypothetical protein
MALACAVLVPTLYVGAPRSPLCGLGPGKVVDVTANDYQCVIKASIAFIYAPSSVSFSANSLLSPRNASVHRSVPGREANLDRQTSDSIRQGDGKCFAMKAFNDCDLWSVFSVDTRRRH